MTDDIQATKLLFDSYRFEDHRRRSDRVSEESPGCDNPDDVFTVCVRADGPADLHGGVDAEVCQSIPRGRLLGQPYR